MSDARRIVRARSIHEMYFFVSLTPCATCDATIDAKSLRLDGQGDAWALTGACPRCRARNAYTFRTYGDPVTAPAPRDELGGPSPSEIISPKRWNDEIDRVLPLVRPDPSALTREEWYANRDANRRLLVCTNELLKFVPEGEGEIPDAALDVEGRADRADRPERYGRAWISALRATCLENRARNVADLPRVEALECAAKASRRRR
ncbi:MAG: hypothetical protein KF819_16535 [Labilithrix sp.]|nr:hypothetical protein [Labilithrix sp.]